VDRHLLIELTRWATQIVCAVVIVVFVGNFRDGVVVEEGIEIFAEPGIVD